MLNFFSSYRLGLDVLLSRRFCERYFIAEKSEMRYKGVKILFMLADAYTSVWPEKHFKTISKLG